MPDPTPTSPSEQRRADESIGTRDLTEWDSRAGRSLTELTARAARGLQPLAGRPASWSLANLAFVLFSVVALGIMTLLTAVAHEVYENVVDTDGIAAFDQPVLDLALSIRSPGLDRASRVLTDVGGPVGMPVLASVAVLVLAITSRRWGPIVIALIAGWTLGLAWALLVVTAHRLHLTLRHHDERGYSRRAHAPALAAPDPPDTGEDRPVTAR